MNKPNIAFKIVPFIVLFAASLTYNQLKQQEPVKEIIFWGPSQIELDSTMNNNETEAYSDYYYYIGLAVPQLKKLGIEIKDTASLTLKINYGSNKTEIFEREEGTIAYVFNDGVRKPKLIKFVMTSDDIISEAKKFFGSKNNK